MPQGAAAAAEAGFAEQQQRDVAYFLWEENADDTDAEANWLLAGKLLTDLVTLERMYDSWTSLRQSMTRNALLSHLRWYQHGVPSDRHASNVVKWVEAWCSPDDREALRVGARYAMNFVPIRAAFADDLNRVQQWRRDVNSHLGGS